jgi:multidrug transporter EmrE-like cation transporter
MYMRIYFNCKNLIPLHHLLISILSQCIFLFRYKHFKQQNKLSHLDILCFVYFLVENEEAASQIPCDVCYSVMNALGVSVSMPRILHYYYNIDLICMFRLYKIIKVNLIPIRSILTETK